MLPNTIQMNCTEGCLNNEYGRAMEERKIFEKSGPDRDTHEGSSLSIYIGNLRLCLCLTISLTKCPQVPDRHKHKSSGKEGVLLLGLRENPQRTFQGQ